MPTWAKYTVTCTALCVLGSMFGLVIDSLTDSMPTAAAMAVCGAAVTAFMLAALRAAGVVKFAALKAILKK